MIPKILHYVWVGGPLPAYQQSFIDTWRSTNPTYQIMGWDESNIDFSHPMLRDAFDRRKWAKVADIVRLMAVARHGGIYLDTDVRLLASLDGTLVHRCFYAFQQSQRSNEWLGNAVFGAEPEHPFIVEALDTLLKMRRPLFGMETPTHYGPRHITRLAVRNGLSEYNDDGVQVGDVFLYPVPVFYPYHWKEQLSDSMIKPETLGIHVWSPVPSWVESLHPVQRMIRRARRFARVTLDWLQAPHAGPSRSP